MSNRLLKYSTMIGKTNIPEIKSTLTYLVGGLPSTVRANMTDPFQKNR